MKRAKKKPFLILGKKPILAHTLLRLQASKEIHEIILVVDKEDILRGTRLVKKYKLSKVAEIMAGGKTRFDSVKRGMGSVDKKMDFVLIHDGVRPFLSSSVISKTIKAASRCGASIAATPATSTIKVINKKGVVDFTPDRSSLRVVATPQVFKTSLLRAAFKKATRVSGPRSDDSALVERFGGKVKVVLDSYENIKITTPLDMVLGKAILKNRGSV